MVYPPPQKWEEPISPGHLNQIEVLLSRHINLCPVSTNQLYYMEASSISREKQNELMKGWEAYGKSSKHRTFSYKY